MKAIVITEPGQADMLELEVPSIGPEDVLIRSYAVGICDSDIELYQGRRPGGYFRYPVVLGHEWAGEVVAVGERVRDIMPGKKAVVQGIISCGVCRNCRMGATNLCEAGYDEIGFTRPGGMAEYVVVPARLVHLLSDDASLEEAALLESVAAVAQGFLRAQPQPGDVIAVIGNGAVSLLAIEMARLYHPAAIVALGLRDAGLEVARQVGATHTINLVREQPEQRMREITAGRGADLVFEGAGHTQAVLEAFHLARRGGMVILEGIADANTLLSVEGNLFSLNHLTVYGIFAANSAAWTHAVHLFRTGMLNLAPLVSHRFALDEYQEALDTVMHYREQVTKVLLLHS